jgi:hypothetical protein
MLRLLATRLFGITLSCLVFAAPIGAQQVTPSSMTGVPRLIRVTGSFRAANGLPPAPVEIVTLAIYAEEKGGVPLWQETQNVTMDAEGHYTIVLGATVPEGLPPELFASGESRWLGMHVERTSEGDQPRIQLTSVPYAMRASDADTLGGKPASAYVLAASDPSSTGKAAGTRDVAAPSVANTSWIPVATDNAGGLGNSTMFQNGPFLGVGTTTPVDVMHVAFTDPNGAFTGYSVQNKAASATSYSGMLFYDQNGALGQFQGFNNVTHEYRINNIASGGSINFMLGSSKFLVAPNGAIGVGSTTPTARLTARANASIIATGTVSTTSGSNALTGAGTKFLTELNVGDRVTIGATTSAVFSVTSDTAATISIAPVTVAGSAMTILPGILRAQNSAGTLAFQVNDAGNVTIGSSITSGAIKLYVTDANRFTGTTTSANITNGNVSIVTTTAQAADVGAVLVLGGSRGTTGLSSFAGLRGAKENATDTEPSGYLGLYTVDSSATFAERMRVTSTGLVGIGTKVPASELEVNGGVRLNTATARPTCDATIRGTFWITQGGAGVKDSVEVCAKDAADTFAWRTLF